MRALSRALIFIGLLSLQNAWSAEPEFLSNEVVGNLSAGSWRLFGTMNFETNSNDRGSSFEFTPGADYFLFDDVAVGWSLGIFSATGRDSVASFGPEIQYEFWKRDRLASYARAGVQFGLSSATTRQDLFGELGAQYFLTSSVEVGPFLRFNHFFSHYNDWDRFAFGAFLGFYL